MMGKIAFRNFPYLTEISVLSAIVVTFLNDHYFKHQFPGFVVGKLSDFAGIYYVPFFIYAVFSFLKSPFGTHIFIRRYYFLICLIVVDVLFIVLKVTSLRPIFVEFFSAYFFKIQIIPDVTDLVALGMNWPSYLVAKKFFTKVSE